MTGIKLWRCCCSLESPERTLTQTAHRLIETFGGLPGVLEAPYEELCRVEGVTANAAVLISFCGQMFRTYYHDKFAAGTILSTVEEAGQYLLPQFLGRREETVYLVCLDNKDKVIAANVVREGSVNAADISARVIVQQALTHNATQVILAHNHPSGFALPSRAEHQYHFQDCRMQLQRGGCGAAGSHHCGGERFRFHAETPSLFPYV